MPVRDPDGLAAPDWREHLRNSRVPLAVSTAERYEDDIWAKRYAEDVTLLLNTIDAMCRGVTALVTDCINGEIAKERHESERRRSEGPEADPQS